MKKNSSRPSCLRLAGTALSSTALLLWGALLPAVAHAASAPAQGSVSGGWLTLGIGLLLLLLRPRAPQPAYELFTQDLERPAELPAAQHTGPRDYRPQRIKVPLAA